MTLSFVIPCYNVERYVAQCLDSVFAVETAKRGFIGDSDYDYEVICVNDCSTDATTLITKAEQSEIKSILKYSHTMFRTKINANAVNTPLQLFARLPYCLFKWFALLFVTLRRKKGRKYYK